MASTHAALIGRIAVATTADELAFLVGEAAAASGLALLGFQHIREGDTLGSGRVLARGPQAGLAEAGQAQLSREAGLYDATVLRAARRVGPVSWQGLGDGSLSPLASLVADHGLGPGMSQASRGPNDLAILHAAPQTAAPLAPGDWLALAPILHERIDNLAKQDAFAEARLALTPRELEVLQGVVAGKTSREIAYLMQPSIAGRTVDEYISSAMAKLTVTSRAQLAARAVALGLVDPR